MANSTRQASMMSSDSGLRDADIGGPDPELRPWPSLLDNNGVSRIFLDAVRYSEAISEEENEENNRTGDGSLKPRNEDIGSNRRFSDLIGRDLSAPELVASSRFAKLSVMKEDHILGAATTTKPGEIDQLDDESDESETAVDVASKRRSHESVTLEDEQPTLRHSISVSQLSSEQIIALLIDEFGSLTVEGQGEGADKERLIWEMDGTYLQDVAILGMIHLTTHRLTFHASLLSTRPDLLPERQIIRTGPVTVHRGGLRRKRRLWLELSHDMLTTFPSSKEEDRIRPIRSVLLSSIKSILPEDEKNKRIIKFIGTSGGFENRYAEFDTEESAREWRRELKGAIYMYRHGRAADLSRQSEDENRGVQISIPLSRVKAFTERRALKYAFLLRVELSSGSVRTSLPDNNGAEPDSEKQDSPRSSEDGGLDMDGQAIELCVTQNLHAWDDFGRLVEEAKEREKRAGVRVPPEVIVDFGALSFVERREEARKSEDDKEESIRNALSLGPEGEIWYTRARVTRAICSSGYLVISKHYIGFWTKCLSITDSKYRFTISKVAGARPNFRYMPHTFGMILDLREHHSMYFDFTSEERRDEVIRRVNDAIEAARVARNNSKMISPPQSPRRAGGLIDLTPSSRDSLVNGGGLTESPLPLATPSSSIPAVPISGSTQLVTASHVLSPLARTINRATTQLFPRDCIPLLPKVINLPQGMIPRSPAAHFVCLTIGSRGDVQPYIALAQELIKGGHRVTIVTHEEYKEWVEGWGVTHRTAGGDPGALMKLSVEHKMFSPQFFKESLGNFRTWLDELLVDAWEQCKDADVLLESPSAMAGVHIAEALNIPYFRTFTMPWTKTAEYPHPFLSPPVDLPHFNTSSYVLFDNVFWAATAGQINRWRRNTLHIGNTDMDHLAQSKIPFIYNFSPSVVPKPLDWGDAITVSGYWFLDNPELNWSPPENLVQWMAKAREEKKPIVYIGFGSITVPNPPAMTRSIVKAVLKSDVRAIISKGWSSRMSKSTEPEFELPPECYSIDKVPHDWLFPQIDAALHHGGAGTTGASLRAGIPTLIKPWFGDQFFWASRVQKIGAGLKVSSLHSSELANALVKATSDRVMKERAASVGENIRLENGVQNAVRAMYTYLDRAGRDRTELD